MKRHLNLITFSLLLLTLIGCNGSSDLDNKSEITYKSDLELLKIDGDKSFFETGIEGRRISNAQFQSDSVSRSGKYSIKIDSTSPYGLNFRLDDLSEGEFIQASVWQKTGAKDGALIASIKGDDYEHKFRSYLNKHDKGTDGWIQHNISFVVTKGVERIDFFVFAGKKIAYFDDLEIRRLKDAPSNDISKRLNLFIPEESKKELDGYISRALKSEIIPKSSKKYVKGFIIEGKDSIKIKLKLKGDWTDHIKSGKTSYRIKIEGNSSFEGMKTFSIQHPKTRNYINEWVIHKLADKEDLLSTSYSFVNVSINGFNYGVYAVEEHFDKQLLESRKRREGPILKFDESGVWALNYKARKQGVKASFPYFNASHVSVFKSGRTLKNDMLKEGFYEGRTLLSLFKNRHEKIEDIFDVEALAKFYVLMELSSNNHGLAWHNRRFYYNPIIQKLEHVVYDVIPYSVLNRYRSLVKLNLLERPGAQELNFDCMVYQNKSFKRYYFEYLEKYTDSIFLEIFFSEINEEMSVFNDAMVNEESSYKFDKAIYFKNAKFLRGYASELDSLWGSVIMEERKNTYWEKEETYFARKDSFFVKEVSLTSYIDKIDSNKYEITIENYHVNDVEIIGFSKKGESLIHFNDVPVNLKKFQTNHASTTILLDFKPKKVHFKVSNYPDTILDKTLINWSKPKHKTTRMKLSEKFETNSYAYKINEDVLSIRGNVVIDKLLFIPKEYTVIIEKGTRLEFKNGGGLICNNSLIAKGTKEQPITIFSKDSSSQGVSVFNGEKVELSHVNFKGLSSLNYKKWHLTGAITIYETPTFIESVSISGNHSEDALNIIRSNFQIKNLLIENTYSDGFDADFCTGIISHSKFVNTGNDCIDFSGSEVDIKEIDILNSGDKGISGGERSTLNIENIRINGAITGVASKDDSKIIGDHINIDSVEYAFAAFQKKGEYAPASIELNNCKINTSNELMLVELGSSIIIDSKEYKGTEKIDIDKLYERFNK